MVQILAPLFGAALLFSGVMAAPRPDSSINEPAVSSPNGIPITEGAAVGTPKVAAYEPMATTSAMMSEASSSAKMMAESSSKMMMESSSKMMMASSSKMMSEATSTKMMSEATSTKKMMEASSTAAATSTMYGSGSSGSSGYDSCVMQCMNTYGAPSAQYTPPPSKSSDSGSSGGGGATHTVIVAPTKGVLRFVPFALNATVGDTIHYVWGAGPHTVTKGTQLEPCNKSADAATFTSGPQNATFTFDEKVTDTNPLFFFCNVPGHCAKGMFGIVNPPNAAPTTATTVAQMMPQWIANNSAMGTVNAYVANMTKGTSAFAWGNNLDVANIPTWAHTAFAENVMYTRLMYAANPGMLEAGVGAGYPDGKPFTRPSDAFDIMLNNLATGVPAANAQAPTPDSASASATNAAPSASAAASSPSASAKGSGAASVASSSALLVGVIAITATFFAL